MEQLLQADANSAPLKHGIMRPKKLLDVKIGED